MEQLRTPAFNPTKWAAEILGCSEQEASERIAVATALLDQEVISSERIEYGGSMARLTSVARGGDPNAIDTVREIDIAFASCDLARRTGTPCKRC